MDKIPVSLMDVIKQYVSLEAPTQFKNSIFMFLSNSASQDITQKSFDLESTNSIKRENFESKMFRKIIEDKIFNAKIKINDDEKGFWHLDLIKSQSIDHYIPFLPLKLEHIKLCIRAEFKKINYAMRSEDDVDAIAEELNYEPEGFYLYSSTGCKRIPQLVRSRIISQKTEL